MPKPTMLQSRQTPAGAPWKDILACHQANALTEKFRKSVSAALASVTFLAPAVGHTQSQSVNTVVNIIPGWKIKAGWPYGHMMIIWSGMFGTKTSWVCNYSKVIDPQTDRRYYVTASHCIAVPWAHKKEQSDLLKNDLYISARLSDEASGRTVVSSDIPRAYLPSKYDSRTVIGQRLTIVGGLPDGSGKNSSLGFSISGKAVPFQEEGLAIPVPKGQFRQMWKTQWQDTISGMSGSPVLDDDGNIFGVLSMVTVPTKFSSPMDYAIVYPLRK